MDVKRRKPNRKSKPMKLKNGNSSSVMMVEMDTMVPLSQLKHMVGLQLEDQSFDDSDIYLQDILLDPELNLYEQGVKVSGSVELSVQTENEEPKRRLTIVEIAKNMTDEELKALGGPSSSSDQSNGAKSTLGQLSHASESSSLKNDDELGIPCDPLHWTPEQVHLWMIWVAKSYNLDVNVIKKTGLSGQELCGLSIEDFFIKFPYGNIFWTHLSMMKKSSFPNEVINSEPSTSANNDAALNLVINDRLKNGDKRLPNLENAPPKMSVHITGEPLLAPYAIEKNGTTSSTRSHTGGQIQLWQFLLELLTDADERGVIQWVGDGGEFKFINPEKVAQKWGERKGKPAMNYEKLSRALRYYYDGDMISKVSGKRFQYKFVCNLKEIVGYDAAELNRMVIECYEKRKAKSQSNNK